MEASLIKDFFMEGFAITMIVILPALFGVMAIRLLLKYI